MTNILKCKLYDVCRADIGPMWIVLYSEQVTSYLGNQICLNKRIL